MALFFCAHGFHNMLGITFRHINAGRFFDACYEGVGIHLT